MEVSGWCKDEIPKLNIVESKYGEVMSDDGQPHYHASPATAMDLKKRPEARDLNQAEVGKLSQVSQVYFLCIHFLRNCSWSRSADKYLLGGNYCQFCLVSCLRFFCFKQVPTKGKLQQKKVWSVKTGKRKQWNKKANICFILWFSTLNKFWCLALEL